jgi:hypothetical protein
VGDVVLGEVDLRALRVAAVDSRPGRPTGGGPVARPAGTSPRAPSPTAAAPLTAAREFNTYLRINAAAIPNYGERYRAGETISSSPAESAVNQVISMVKKQQMRWTPRGTHLLLQVRTRVLNNDLAADFRRWYPGFTHASPAALNTQPTAA